MARSIYEALSDPGEWEEMNLQKFRAQGSELPSIQGTAHREELLSAELSTLRGSE